jgi:hypothetical protein
MAWLHNVRRLRVRFERLAIARRQPRVLEWPLYLGSGRSDCAGSNGGIGSRVCENVLFV